MFITDPLRDNVFTYFLCSGVLFETGSSFTCSASVPASLSVTSKHEQLPCVLKKETLCINKLVNLCPAYDHGSIKSVRLPHNYPEVESIFHHQRKDTRMCLSGQSCSARALGDLHFYPEVVSGSLSAAVS